MATTLPAGPRGRALAAGLTVVVFAVAWVAVVTPLLAWHADRAELLDQRLALAQRMESAAAALPQLRRDAAGAASSPAPRALLDGATDAIAGAGLQSVVGTLARQAGLDLSSVEVLPAEAAGAYRRIGLRLVLNGSWPALVGLLDGLSQATPRMLVDDVQVQVAPSVTAGTAQSVAATLTVIAFRAGVP